MFTVCPKCTLTLAVTANDLRVGQGYVRCGRCSNVFNALLRLSEALDDADSESGAPVVQADPASSSQISRAISSEAAGGSTTTTPAAPRSATAGGTSATAGTRSPIRGSTAGAASTATAAPGAAAAPAAPTPATPATPSPATPAPAATAPPAPSATATRPGATSTAAGTPLRRSTDQPGQVAAPTSTAAPSPAAARSSAPIAPPPPSTPAAAPRATQARPATHVPPAPQAAPAQTTRAPLPPAGARAAASTAASPTAASAADPRPRHVAQMAAPAPAPPRAARTTSAPAANAKPEASPFAAPPPGGSHTPTDEEAIDQFALVLKTLGLSLDEDEPPLHQPTSSTPEPGGSEPDAPTRVVENIVLEGDGVSQSQDEVPDRPLDELDQFTRRLSRASGEAGRPPVKRKPGESAPGRRPAGPPPARRSTAEARPPRAAQIAGRSARPAARGPESPEAHRTDASRDPREPDDYDEISFEEEAALDDLSLNDPMLDEPLPAESIELMEEAPPSADLQIPALQRNPYRWAWLTGCLLLALLLVLQVIGHWRERLALSPTWGGAVRAVYAAVGAPIAPRWDLTAYEVRQQGAESEPGQRAQIRVRFSLANHATHAQPVPLLRLTLLDRYGRRVAQRDLTPADYWPQGRAPAAFLASDERIDTEVQVRDPSADSASFELDVCLRDARGLLHCAGDANAGGAAAGAGADGAP